MTKFYFFPFLLFGVGVCAQDITFPDPDFKAHLLNSSATSNIARNLSGQFIKIDSNSDGEIQVDEAAQVGTLVINGQQQVENIQGIEYFVNLEVFYSSGSDIDNADFTALTSLKKLSLISNGSTQINIAGLTNLEELDVKSNELTTIDLTGLSGLKQFNATGNPLASLDVSPLVSVTHVDLEYTNLTSLDFSNSQSILDLICSEGELESLNISGCGLLQRVIARTNNLTSIDLSNVPSLEILVLDANPISTIDLSSVPDMKELLVNVTNIAHIDLSQLPLLKEFYCNYTPMEELDVTHNPALELIMMSDTKVRELDLSQNPELYYLLLFNSLLQTLDVSNNPQMGVIQTTGSPLLKVINMKNSSSEYALSMANCPQLQYICCDQTDIPAVLSAIGSASQGISVNSYCSPGSLELTQLTATAILDANGDGCNESDIDYPYINYTINSDLYPWTQIGGLNGSSLISLTPATHTITPVLENPEYFTVYPASVTVTVPSEEESLTQMFCITTSVNIADLEVNIFSQTAAVPGFNSLYTIIYRNKGTQTMSGSVQVTYEDDVTDFISSAQAPSSTSPGLVVWDFADLTPLETRTIIFVMNLNTPTDIPSLNAGHQLDFIAQINPIPGDAMPLDNMSGLKQVVVNSADPNDITCLEGSVIGTDKVGEYVHYMIRFENVGTYQATNVIVKNEIDALKFDISSIVPLHSSHPFVTTVIGNTITFASEGINLPFEDENNDGYIVYKIRTRSDLSAGDTFANDARIYFDFNLPVVTNTVTTTIQLLNTFEFDYSQYITIYPNPANDVLKIEVSDGITPKSASVYNMIGQKVIALTEWQSEIDVTRLESGTYFIKLESDRGSVMKGFVKR